MELSYSTRNAGDDRPSLLASSDRGVGVSRRGIGRGEFAVPSSLAAAADELRRRRRETIERINTKLHAFFWVLAAVLTVYYTRIWEVVWSDPRILSVFIDIAFVGLGISLSIMLFLTVYLPKIRGINVDWDVYDPRLIPTATIAGVVTVICLLIGMWPVYGLLTPAILAILFMGSIMALHFIPSC